MAAREATANDSFVISKSTLGRLASVLTLLVASACSVSAAVPDAGPLNGGNASSSGGYGTSSGGSSGGYDLGGSSGGGSTSPGDDGSSNASASTGERRVGGETTPPLRKAATMPRRTRAPRRATTRAPTSRSHPLRRLLPRGMRRPRCARTSAASTSSTARSSTRSRPSRCQLHGVHESEFASERLRCLTADQPGVAGAWMCHEGKLGMHAVWNPRPALTHRGRVRSSPR